jgi:hypothetical protein
MILVGWLCLKKQSFFHRSQGRVAAQGSVVVEFLARCQLIHCARKSTQGCRWR